MRDHHDRLAQVFVELPQHLENDVGIFRVEVTCWLVGKQDFWFVDDGARDGDALLLAPGEFGRFVMQASVESEHFGDDIEAMRIEAVAVNELGDGDVALRVQGGKQIESLEDEADFVAAQLGARGVAHLGEVVAVHKNVAARSLRKPADHVKQRRFCRIPKGP